MTQRTKQCSVTAQPESVLGFTGNAYLPFEPVPLTNGGVTLVSIADMHLIAGRDWSRKPSVCTSYAWSYKADGVANDYMHRVLLGLESGDGRIGDHINGDGLDNRRENLRICDYRENAWNRVSKRVSQTGFKGVWLQHGKAFVTRIGSRGRDVKYLGCYPTAIEAAVVWNDEALLRYGVFSKLNVIPREAEARALIERKRQLQAESAEIDRQLKDWPCA